MDLRINMAVSSAECGFDGIPDLGRSGLPSPETNEWNLVPSVKDSSFPTGYHIWSVSYWQNFN